MSVTKGQLGRLERLEKMVSDLSREDLTGQKVKMIYARWNRLVHAAYADNVMTDDQFATLEARAQAATASGRGCLAENG